MPTDTATFIPAWIPAQMHGLLNVQSFVDVFDAHPWLEARMLTIKADADKAMAAGDSEATPVKVYQMGLMGGASFALAQMTAFAPPKAQKSVSDPWSDTFSDAFSAFMADVFESALYDRVVDWAREALKGRTAEKPVPCAGVPSFVKRCVDAFDAADDDVKRDNAINELVFLTAHSFGSHTKLVKTSSGRTWDAVNADGKVLRKSPDGKVFKASIAYGIRASGLQVETTPKTAEEKAAAKSAKAAKKAPAVATTSAAPVLP